jgi:hypothetical protein
VHSHLQVPALGSAPARAAVSVWCTAEAHIQLALAPSIVEVAVECAVEARTTAAPGAPSRVVSGRSQPGD